jgi:transposase
VEQRERFIADERRSLYSRTELCARCGIRRKTGYKWLERFEEEGRRGLRDRCQAPHDSPHRIASDIAEMVCKARRLRPDWGPRKLLDWLAPRHLACAFCIGEY